ncbi:hypothetical protein IQ07DRAFT_663526 [Pyrenochaeta sp. DS3sAY3a]|nr:hypothetical protein IQ07DRAFT_663526 [Pyrenochaeta sp. DS3sAY3a]
MGSGPSRGVESHGRSKHRRENTASSPEPIADISESTTQNEADARRVLAAQKFYDKLCVWSGPIGLTFFFLIFPSGNFLPPLHPARTPDEVIGHYRKYEPGIKGAAALMQFVGCFYPLYIAVISSQMSRIPGVTHAITSTQCISGGISTYTVTLPSLAFCLASYRLDTRSPELISLLNDAAWFLTVMPFVTFISGNFAFSYAVLLDKRPRPLFPKWFAYASTIWPFGFWGALGMHCVYDGAFAWNGGFTFWTGAVAIGVGTVMNVWVLLKAIDTTDEECERPLEDIDAPIESCSSAS